MKILCFGISLLASHILISQCFCILPQKRSSECLRLWEHFFSKGLFRCPRLWFDYSETLIFFRWKHDYVLIWILLTLTNKRNIILLYFLSFEQRTVVLEYFWPQVWNCSQQLNFSFISPWWQNPQGFGSFQPWLDVFSGRKSSFIF